MIYLALAALALAALTVWLAFQTLRAKDRGQDRERQSWAAERRELNDRLAHMAYRAWNPSPRDTERELLLGVMREQRRDEAANFADVDNEPV